jgi:hypothetical protein
MRPLRLSTVSSFLAFAVVWGLGPLPAWSDDRGDGRDLGGMLAQGYGDPYGRGYDDPNAGRRYADAYGRGYVDPNAGRGYAAPDGRSYGDPYGARGYVDPNAGRGYAAPDGRSYGDPYGARGYVDPNAGRGYGVPYAPSVPPPSYGGGYPPPGSYPSGPYNEPRRDVYRPVFPEPQPRGYGPSPQVLALTDQLVGQVDAFFQVFSPTAGVVPEGRQFLADAQQLRAAASTFRQVAAGGAAPARLSSDLRTIEALYQNLAQRTNRIARGRNGANIQQVGLMGQTLQQLRLACP